MNINELQTIEKINPDLELVISKSGLEKAITYGIAFDPMMKKVIEVSAKLVVLNKENPSKEDCKIARECRLALVKNRTITADEKDKLKSTLITEGNLIQSLHNVIVNKSKLIEADFEYIEKVLEIRETARKGTLKKDRIELLAPYELDLSSYDLGGMDEIVFTNLLEGQKLLKQQREDLARQQEAEKIEQAAAFAREQEKIKAENTRLKEENDLKEKQLQQERAEAKAAADKLENQRKIDLEFEKSKQQDIEKAAAKKLADQKAISDNLAAELKAKQDDAERQLKQLQDDAEKELSKGDTEKFADLINDLELLKTKYIFKSKKYNTLYAAIIELINKIINYATK